MFHPGAYQWGDNLLEMMLAVSVAYCGNIILVVKAGLEVQTGTMRLVLGVK